MSLAWKSKMGVLSLILLFYFPPQSSITKSSQSFDDPFLPNTFW